MIITTARLSAMTRSRPQLRSSRRRGCAAPGATDVLISAFGSMFLTCEQLNLYHAATMRATGRDARKLFTLGIAVQSHRAASGIIQRVSVCRTFHSGLPDKFSASCRVRVSKPLSFRAKRGISLYFYLNRSEIPRFARNDRITCLLRRLFIQSDSWYLLFERHEPQPAVIRPPLTIAK